MALKRWLLKSRTKTIQTLKISCKTCAMDVDDIPVSNDPGEKPFIVINFNKQDNSRRNRRNSDCQPNSTYCCKEPLFVNFSHIGWDDWIIAPAGYQVNFCRGSCLADAPTSGVNYRVIIQVIQVHTTTHANINQLCNSFLRFNIEY